MLADGAAHERDRLFDGLRDEDLLFGRDEGECRCDCCCEGNDEQQKNDCSETVLEVVIVDGGRMKKHFHHWFKFAGVFVVFV